MPPLFFLYVLFLSFAISQTCFWGAQLVFFVFLYQRWIYPINKARANEFGYAYADEAPALEPEPKPATPHAASPAASPASDVPSSAAPAAPQQGPPVGGVGSAAQPNGSDRGGQRAPAATGEQGDDVDDGDPFEHFVSVD